MYLFILFIPVIHEKFFIKFYFENKENLINNLLFSKFISLHVSVTRLKDNVNISRT